MGKDEEFWIFYGFYVSSFFFKKLIFFYIEGGSEKR